MTAEQIKQAELNQANILSQQKTQLKFGYLTLATSVYHGTGAPSADIFKLAKDIEEYVNN